MNWRRESKVDLPSLPQERKALAERYTIDAEEAAKRAQRAAEQAAAEEAERRAAAEEAARLAAAELAARKEAEAAAMRAAAESARRAAEEEAERRAAVEQAARADASAALKRELAEQAQAVAPTRPELEVVPTPANPEPAAEPGVRVVVAAPAEEDQATQTAELPIYRWFSNG